VQPTNQDEDMTDARTPRQQKHTPFDQLRRQMAASFNLEELNTLCFDLKVNFDELPHSGLTPRIRDLIQVMERSGRVPDLLTAVSQAQPHIDWPDLADLEAATLSDVEQDTQGYQARLSGSGPRRVCVGGDVYGIIITGDNNIINYLMPVTKPDSEGILQPPFMYSPLQENFVERPHVIREVSERLHAKKGTVAIVGAGGAGKTTLTTRLCYEEAIHEAFPDGILWVKLGPELNPTQIFNRLTSLYQILTRKSTEPIDSEDAIQKLATELRNKQCLIVIDDVWDIEHLRPFLQGGKECVHLITTRRNDIALEVDGSPIKLDKMSIEEATELLLQQLNPKPKEMLPFEQLAKRLGQWPLALELTGKQLHQLISMAYTPDNALKYVNDAHDREGITVFDRTAVIAKSLNISLELLDQEKTDARDYFCQLVVFPNTIDIPLPAISALWGFDEYETRKRLHLMDNFSLLKFSSHAIRLHYVIYQYLISRLDSKAEEVLHQKLLNGYNPSGKLWHEVVQSVSDHNYLGDYLTYHLECAKRDKDIHKLFTTDDWAKLRRAEDLLSDFGNARQLAHKTGADIAIRIRYALFNEIVQQRYRNIPVEALPALMSNGTVASTLIMSAMQTMLGDEAAKTHAYLEIVSKAELSRALQEDYAPHILEIAHEISEAEPRARLTMELATFLPDQLKQEAYKTAWQAIFEMESKEIRKELLEKLWANLSETGYQQLQKDALTIKNAQQRIRVIYQIDQLLGKGQRDLWREIIFSILKKDYSSEDVYTFATLVNHVPAAFQPMLNQEAGEAIWQALSARTYWEDNPYYEFLENVLEVLMPYVPPEHIYDAWERAKLHNESFVAEWSMVTVASSDHFLDDLIPELQRKMASMGRARYCAEFLVAFQLPPGEQEKVLLETWLAVVKENTSEREMKWLTTRLPKEVAWQAWEEIPSLLQSWTPSIGNVRLTSVLASRIPSTNVPEACLDCFQFTSNKWHFSLDLRAETIKTLIERLPLEQQKRQWDKVIEDALEKHLPPDKIYGSSDRRTHFAITITMHMPDVWRQDKWLIILPHLRAMQDSEQKAALLTHIVPELSVQNRAQLWLETWSLAATTGRYHQWAQQSLLGYLPQIYRHNIASEEFVTQLASIYHDTEAFIGESYPDFYHSDVQAGFALLLLHAPQSFALKVWEKTKQAYQTSHHQYLWMPILPYLSSEQQKQVLPKMLGNYYGSVPEIGTYLINQWPEEIIKKAWEILCTTTGNVENNQHNVYLGYPNFAHALIPYLPESYRLTAWQLASKRITPKYWDNWPEMCETVLRSLPDEDVPKAWDDLLEIERKNPRFLFSYQLKRALAPRLPDERLGTLVQVPQGNKLFSETIFTCSLAQYLQQGGLWGDNRHKEVEVDLREKWFIYSSVFHVLLLLWSYLAYLFVPLLYSISLFLPGLKKIPGLKKVGRFLQFLRFALFLLTPRKLRVVWNVIGWPFAAFGSLLSTYQEIVSYSALPKSQASAELEKILLSEGGVTAKLIKARPLIQRVGGAKLRQAAGIAYSDAQTWWKDVFIPDGR
jgi:hypothetical protein